MDKKSASQNPLKQVLKLQKELHRWFGIQGKDLPWRKTQDPWAILVSEIMLQQTTVAAVIANRRFEKFLEEYPDLKTIAKAPEAQLLKSWEGLGYYNRVRNLKKAAVVVLEQFEGEFPKDAMTLETLPGIGRYTAGAVSSFAFGQAAPIVDANIARVISRVFDYPEEIDSTAGQRQIWKWAGELLDVSQPRLFNSAIMELGQTHCSSQNPDCTACPIVDFCQTSNPEELPKKKPRKKFIAIEEHAIFATRGNEILLVQEEGSRRNGFWRLPLKSPEEVAHLEPISKHRYTITNHKVMVILYELSQGEGESEGTWVLMDELTKIPIASPIRKIIESRL